MSTSCVVCGTKSQDYTIECYCCGNYYCSDKCKVQDHQKKPPCFCRAAFCCWIDLGATAPNLSA